MSNSQALAVIDSNIFPALGNISDVTELMNANIGEGEQIGFSDLIRIKMPSGETKAFSVPSLEMEEDEMLSTINGIVIHWHNQRAFWPKSVSEGGDPQPLCYSPDGIEGKGKWDMQKGDPGSFMETEEEKVRTCADCPMAEYESAPDGKRQWCKAMRRLYVIRPGEMLPTIMTMPPSSLKPCKTFFSQLTSRGIPHYLAPINIGLEAATAERVGEKSKVQKITYMKATFRLAGLLNDDQKKSMREFRNLMLPFLKSFSEKDVPVEAAAAE